MIIGAYGFPGLSLLEITHMLNRLGVSYGVVKGGRLIRVEGRMERQSITPVVFQNARMLLQYGRKFRSTRVVALVLDNPYTLHHELQLDVAGAVVTKKAIQFEPFTEQDLKGVLMECRGRTTGMTFQRRPYHMVNEVLKDYSASSLSALQTFLYKIKDVEARTQVSKVVKKWMCSDQAFDALEPKLKRYVAVNHIESLRSILTTPSMKTFREAVKKAAACPSRLPQVAKSYKVNAFDIKYLLSTNA